MTAWLLPVLAGTFWAGLLLHAGPLSGQSPSVFVGAGFAVLGGGAWLASRRADESHALETAGLIRSVEPAAVRALDSPAPGVPRAPPALPVIATVVGVVLLGAGWAGVRESRLRSSYLARAAGAWVSVQGSLTSDPERSPFGWTALAEVREVWGEDVPAVRLREGVWLEGDGRPPAARRADRFQAEGLLVRTPDGSFGEYLARRGVAAILQADSVARIGPATNPVVRAAQATREFLLRRVRELFDARDAGLLMGLALGDTSMLDPGDEEHFRATGLSHLLAVSGGNVAMVLAPMLGLALLLRLSARGKFVLGSATVLFFVLLTGAEPSVLRAGVMTGLTLLGILLGRPGSTGVALGGAVLILLVADPALAWSVGFQLSVAATAGIVALGSPLAKRLAWLPRPLAVAAGTTLGAQAGVLPLLLFHFQQVPGSTLVANVLAFPAVAPAMLMGLAAAGTSAVVPPVGSLLAHVAELPLRYLEEMADRLSSAPFPWATSPGGYAPLVIGLPAVALVAWWLRSGRRLPKPILVAAVLAVPLFVWSTALRAGPPSGVVVRFFDVGQGDAALVQSPDGANVLVDGGPDPQLAATKLAALGIKRLDAVVATHPHLDHYVGLPAVLARFPVGLVIDSGCKSTESLSSSYQAFLEAVRRERVPERHPVRGDEFFVGGLRFDVLSPDRCWQGTNSDPNNDSLVLLLSYREDTVLFANEPEGPAQQVMLDDHMPLAAEVLNVPHHGAATSILPFFQAVHEAVAIVSVGPNDYGHPVPRVLEELRETGARVFRTDRSGDVVVRFEDPGLLVTTGSGRQLAIESAA